jgi:mRNA-degrading endonuclease toxin of MazEF toxin-antitoxin module
VALIGRGEIWVARLNPNQGAEVGKVRPVVVIQADALTDAGLATVLVVPLTTQWRRGAEALKAGPARGSGPALSAQTTSAGSGVGAAWPLAVNGARSARARSR